MKKLAFLLAVGLVFGACSGDKKEQKEAEVSPKTEKIEPKAEAKIPPKVENEKPKIELNLGQNSDKNQSAQNPAPKVEIEIMPQNEGKISKDINASIDEFAKTAKILGENLEKLSKEAPKIIDEFAKNNADKFEDLAKKGEKIVRDLNGSLEVIQKDLMDLAKDANSSFGQILNLLDSVINNGTKIERHYENEGEKDLKI